MPPRHYLYPLNPKSTQEYYFEDGRGNRYPTSVQGFFDCYTNEPSAEWGIYQGINDLKPKDYIWVHFALPVSAIMAVGRVREKPHYNALSERYAIWIDWDWKLTKQLQERPIPFSSHHQVVPVSVREANAKTQSVIQKWMQGSSVGKPTPKLKPVKFKEVVIQERQGQPEFRQALMVAYNYRCAVTGCDVRDTLQAAHIVPVSSQGTHDIQNGLLLRADIHNLFDRGLLTISNSYIISLHPSIRTSPIYKALHGRKLAVIPRAPSHKPSIKYLTTHRENHLST
jgi:hypothetical protein